ncbi:MAG: MFS transporter [Chlamydiae bacterium]|nr:MFS transporter [Chlamydiota bacterium]
MQETTSPTLKPSTKALFRARIFLLICGFVTKSNGIFLAINQGWFGLDYTRTMLAPLCFFFASFFIAPIAGDLLHRFGYKKGMIAGLLMCAVSCCLLYVTYINKQYVLFLASIFLLGGGVKFMLVAGPSYAIVFGPKETESGRLSATQAFYSIGSLVAPGVLLWIFSSESTDKPSVVAFSYIAFFLAWMAICWGIYRIKKLPVREETIVYPAKKGIFDIFPPFTLSLGAGFTAMFMYMGIEVCMDSFLVKFLHAPEGGGLSLQKALSLFSLYYLGFVVGRLIGAPVLNRIPLSMALLVNSVAAIATFAVGMYLPPEAVFIMIVVLGLCNSVMYPLILAIGVKLENAPPSKVVGFLSTAAIGGALFPVLQGYLADTMGLRFSFILPVFGYVALFMYGIFVRRKEIALFKEKEVTFFQEKSSEQEN